MSYSVSDIEEYVNALEKLRETETKLVQEGFMFEDEALTLYNDAFVVGRLVRLKSLTPGSFNG